MAAVLNFIAGAFWSLVRIAGIVLLVFAVFYFVTMKKAVKIKDEIDKDPEAYFAKQEEERKKQYREENGIIDADYQVTGNERIKEGEKVK